MQMLINTTLKEILLCHLVNIKIIFKKNKKVKNYIAICNHNETITNMLIEKGADVNKTNSDGMTPLIMGKLM
jgi:ankyrin repeat protein